MVCEAGSAFQSIGTGIAQEEFAGKFFANGANQKIALVTPDNMSEPQLAKLREAWMNKYAGSANSHNPLVLYGGMDIKTVSISNEDSQLLESRRFTVEDIARAYGVPPFMIGHNEKTTSWGSGVESMGQGFLTFTLQPHLNRIQQEINRKIFRTSKYFVEFKTIGLLAADVTARAKYQREAIGGSQGPGWLTINEVRRSENMPPIDGGEALYVPQKPADMKTAAPGASNA
jgi:HK97 family phage portal protein